LSDNNTDHYSVLGVEPTASELEIKRAYRKLVFQFHPDRNPDDEDAVDNFKRILRAYEVLSDNDKRAQYDEATQSVFKDRPPRSDGDFKKGFRYSHDFRKNPGPEPRCPECSVAGTKYITTKKAVAGASRGKQFIDAPFSIVFCSQCGHVYGVVGTRS
jgi:curved DNA-binding protein CbpA